jgi:hypothetical protein
VLGPGLADAFDPPALHQIADEITSAATVMDSIFGEAKGP